MIIPNRTIQHSDGKVELRRIVNPPLPKDWNPDDPLPLEASIVWLLPVESLDYVRVAIIHNALTPSGRLALKGNVVLAGYSTLIPEAPTNPRTKAYSRRLFYLVLEDNRRNLNDLPENAVDPRTLLPGQSGSPPDVSTLNRGYPRHIRRRRRSMLRHPVSLSRILAQHHQLQVTGS